jgi:hypothetical protein
VAKLSRFVNELSNLTVLQSSELAKMLAETWRVRRDPSDVRKSSGPNEREDVKLMEELIFQPNDVLLEPFSKEEMAEGKTPDFKLMKESVLRGYCELKSPRDDWVFELPASIKPGEVFSTTRPHL